jgi:hypothetical protein
MNRIASSTKAAVDLGENVSSGSFQCGSRQIMPRTRRLLSREESASARRTDGCRGAKLLAPGALAGQPIEAGRLCKGMAGMGASSNAGAYNGVAPRHHPLQGDHALASA